MQWLHIMTIEPTPTKWSTVTRCAHVDERQIMYLSESKFPSQSTSSICTSIMFGATYNILHAYSTLTHTERKFQYGLAKAQSHRVHQLFIHHNVYVTSDVRWSRMATRVGLPLIGAQYLSLEGWKLPEPTALKLFVVAALLEALMQRGLKKAEAVFGVGAMACVAIFSRSMYVTSVGILPHELVTPFQTFFVFVCCAVNCELSSVSFSPSGARMSSLSIYTYAHSNIRPLYGRYTGRAGAALVVAAAAVGTSHNRRTAGLMWNIDLFHLLLAAAMVTICFDLLSEGHLW